MSRRVRIYRLHLRDDNDQREYMEAMISGVKYRWAGTHGPVLSPGRDAGKCCIKLYRASYCAWRPEYSMLVAGHVKQPCSTDDNGIQDVYGSAYRSPGSLALVPQTY